VVRNIILVGFMAIWGVVVIIVAIQEKGKVPPEYWTLPAIGLGAILGAFSAWEERRNGRNRSGGEEPSPEDEGTST
jgi:hypothetical protein